MFQNATEIISGEKYPTLGIVQPLLQKLLSRTLRKAVDDKPLTKRIKAVIGDDLRSQYQNDIKLKLYVAMYLDPRFKAMSFLDDSTKDDIKDSVKLELTMLIEQQDLSTDEDVLLPPSIQRDTVDCSDRSSSMWVPAKGTQFQDEIPPPKLTSFFDGMIGPTNISVLLSPDEIALHEIRRYDAEDPETLDMKEPLKWCGK